MNLPYPYFKNPRGGSLTSWLVALIMSGVFAGLIHYGYLSVPLSLALIPIAMNFLQGFLFNVIRNAVHDGMRKAEADFELDEMRREQDAREQNAALTPSVFSAKLIDGAE
jgi:hypothetical protein